MIEDRDPRSDLLAVFLLVATVFLTVSLATYDSADPVPALFAPLDRFYQADVLHWPVNETPRNLFGGAGSLTANFLLTTLGYAAWLLVGGLGAIVAALFHKQSIHALWTRWAGWLMALLGTTTLLHLTIPETTAGPLSGPGGFLGSLGAGLLQSHFAGTGGIILATSFIAIGLFLWTEYLFVKGVGTVVVTVASLFQFALPLGAIGRLRTLFRLPSLRRPSVGLDDDDVDNEDEEDLAEEDSAQSGRPSIVADYEDEQDDDDEDDWEDEPVDDDVETIPFSANIAANAAVAEVDEDDAEIDDAEVDPDEEDVESAKTKRKRGLFGLKRRGSDGNAEAPESSKPATQPSAPPRAAAPRPVDERTAVMHQLDAAALKDEPADYDLPAVDLLKIGERVPDEQIRAQTLRRGKLLEQKFAEFGYQVRVVDIDTGPVITQYEIELETGLRLSKIMGLADDIAIGLRVPSVRIVAPIPGKNSVGIEVPNETRQTVLLRDVMEASTEQTRKMKIPLFLGQDVSGNTLVADLAKLPHLLIAGRTGTGKSVCLNAIITSMLMTRRPDEVRMLMIDPKMVELSGYSRLPHLMHPVVTDMKKAEAILAWAVDKMEERYKLMARAGVRHLNSYNQLGEEELMARLQPVDEEERDSIPINMPFIVIVADEMADLMMTAGKEVEQHIIRLAQKSRAVGIHLILATQKPTVDVVTGLIKSNLPARIAFQVASQTDSRVVLDSNGAEKLLGNGDLLFLGPGTSTLLRGQGTYVSDDEIDAITESVSTGEQNFVNELINIQVEGEDDGEQFSEKLKNRDELYHRAVETVITEQRGSVSLLQRVLGIGYGRAARLIDFMEEDGVVGPYNGSKSRDIIMTMDQWIQFKNGQDGSDPTPALPANSPLAIATKSNQAVAMAEDEVDDEYDAAEESGDDGDEPGVSSEYDEEAYEEGDEEYEYEEESEEDDEYEYEEEESEEEDEEFLEEDEDEEESDEELDEGDDSVDDGWTYEYIDDEDESDDDEKDDDEDEDEDDV